MIYLLVSLDYECASVQHLFYEISNLLLSYLLFGVMASKVHKTKLLRLSEAVFGFIFSTFKFIITEFQLWYKWNCQLELK